MLLTPRYGEPPVLRFEGAIDSPAVPLVRQRRRLGEVLAGLDDTQWAAPSRCEAWSVRDVAAHLADTDQFWVLVITAALDGAPTRFLTAFDPVATPALLVEGSRHQTSAEVLARYLDGVEAMAAAVEGLDDAQWSLPTEAPPGHVPLHAAASHALWDAWIHERDIAIPLGLEPVEEPDEIVASLRYAAALGPAFVATQEPRRSGALVVDGTDPDAHVVVTLGETVVVDQGPSAADAVRIEGRSVDLVEALSLRAPFPHDVAPADRWIVGGLATVFDQAG